MERTERRATVWCRGDYSDYFEFEHVRSRISAVRVRKVKKMKARTNVIYVAAETSV